MIGVNQFKELARVGGKRTYTGETSTHGLVLERRRLRDTERVVLGRGRDRRGGGEVVGIPAVAAGAAFVIVSVMKTLLRGLRAEGEGSDLLGDVRGGGGAGHDGGSGCAAC